VYGSFDSGVAKLNAGASLECHFLFFNLNAERVPEAVKAKQSWFREVAFRRAVSLAADRKGMSRLAFEGQATPLSHHVTAGNKAWVEAVEARYEPREAQRVLQQAGFRLQNGVLQDRSGQPVEFTLAVNAANAAQMQLATILQADLKAIGMNVRLTPLEFRSLVDRVTKTLEFDAALMALVRALCLP
jgi:peptide/nickel transport system substrate-binding protein